MNTGAFVFLAALSLGAYFFGDFNALYGLVPEAGSTVNAWVKGLLLGFSAWIGVNKLRDYVTINSSVKFLIVITCTIFAYLFEAGKEQRIGRKLLSQHFNPEAADGAWIHYTEKGKWSPNAVLIEFSQTDITPSKDFPNYRKIPYCNIRFQGANELLSKIPIDKLAKASFYWNKAVEASETKFKVVALVSDNRNWFFESTATKDELNLSNEDIENARVKNEDASYIDQNCANAPFSVQKKLYSSNKILKSEWFEKDGSEKFNEILYDASGNPLNGKVAAEFVYFVEKSEEFQKGFGKAGMLKCTGHYTYRNGIKDGSFEFFYPGGIARAFTGYYSNGQQVGTHKQFNPNGTLKKSWNLGGLEEEKNTPALTR